MEEDRAFIERLTEEEGCPVLRQFGTQMAEWVVKV